MTLVPAALLRGLAALGLWLLLYGDDLAGMAVGITVAAAAAWVSLRLLPPASARLRPLALGALGLHFLWQSVVAGVDVAWRALDPRLPLQPGYVTCRLRLAPGPWRSAFLALASLLPGSLPAEVAPDGRALIHGLDLRQPVAEDIAAAEARFAGIRRSG
ncbi:MAG: Na+/H+ antiporter subunit E [Geminicoccaceae bacterium]